MSRKEQSDAAGPIVVAANSAWNVANFRKELIADLIESGHRVVVVAPDDGHADRVRRLGADFVPIAVDSAGLSPFRDLRLLMNYRRVLKQVKPAAFLGFTVKPNIYGSLAAASLGIGVINNISGLGTAFMRAGLLQALVAGLYRVALRRSKTVFFQNRDDLDLFVSHRIVPSANSFLLPGSGVDLERFLPQPNRPSDNHAIRFLMIARILRDKGVVEYVEAARVIRREFPDARFQILGSAAARNRSAVPATDIERWKAEGIVEMLGETDDVRAFIVDCDCVVLPSYREGLPRSLLEASAMARPIIASDVPGCRDVVVDGMTGFLCAVRSPSSLAAAMRRMIDLSAEERAAMGARGRARVEREFDARLVSRSYLEALAR